MVGAQLGRELEVGLMALAGVRKLLEAWNRAAGRRVCRSADGDSLVAVQTLHVHAGAADAGGEVGATVREEEPGLVLSDRSAEGAIEHAFDSLDLTVSALVSESNSAATALIAAIAESGFSD